jgi:hypothetical protein
MITVKGLIVSQRQTKKGKNLYLLVLPNGNFVKIITSRVLELLKPAEITGQNYIANNNQLILLLD